MDEEHLLNPVRAKLVGRASDWQRSSARAHLAGKDDHVVTVAPVLERTGKFNAFLDEPVEEAEAYGALRRAEAFGRPIGNASWLKTLEQQTGRVLMPAKRGRKLAQKVLSKLSP